MEKYYLGQYEKSMPSNLSWNEKLNLSKEFGFDYLEISIDETEEKLSRLNWGLKEKKEILNAIYSSNQRINTMCLSGHRKYPLGHESKEIQKKSLDIMRKAIDLSSDLGIRIIQVAGYDVYYEKSNSETKKIFEYNLQECVYEASKKGVVLGFETMETDFMDTVEKAMVYVKKINSPYLGIYPDIGNLTNASIIYNKNVNEDLKLGKGHIFAAHLKETVPNCYREIEFGLGHTKFEENIKVLNDLGVRMFTGEFWYTNNENWKKVCLNSCKFLRDKLDKVFKKI